MTIALAIVCAFALLAVLACCKVAGDCTKEEERARENEQD